MREIKCLVLCKVEIGDLLPKRIRIYCVNKWVFEVNTHKSCADYWRIR